MQNKINCFRGQYSFLSNMYAAPVTYNGLTYKNSEAAFQAQKTLDYNERKLFCGLTGPEAKRLGKTVNLRSDWDLVKQDIMYNICYAKFSQNKELAKKLMETGNVYLEEENKWGDTYWGTVNGKGLNYLGKILMTIRDGALRACGVECFCE